MKSFYTWLCVDNPYWIFVVAVGVVIGLLSFSILINLMQMRNSRHAEFLRRQDVCSTHGAWYEMEDNYHGLMACYDLDTHELFYVVPETGLALVPRQ